MKGTSLFTDNTKRPLADRVRPKTIAEFIGQSNAVGEGTLVRSMINGGAATSLILWGPPGTGKTTLARLIASQSNYAFAELSAVTSGLPDVKKVIEQAGERRRLGQATLLFVDEIHRFNKAQQDAFLPHVENGTIILIGATTENPSFEVIGPLLSRSRVITLEALTPDQLKEVIRRGLAELPGKTLDPPAADMLANLAGGDARIALTALETAAELTGSRIEVKHIEQALGHITGAYDKTGENHYNFISAYIKSLRGGAVDAALYYLVRMLDAGEEAKFIARRLVIFASEDIGLADPAALPLAVAAFQAIERIGLPEGRITLAHATIALATAGKDRRAYDALGRASAALREHPHAQVPLHLRNATTKLMGEQGYGSGYQWQAGFEHPEGFLPPELARERFFEANPPDQSTNS
ncbi:MAG TPA: replication-associated recombination protein A [Candidatus Saccharimonadia bacterium]